MVTQISESCLSPHVAVIGAGISGLSCARTLSQAGFKVDVFDKGRRPGGRMSTRRTGSGLTFDHGCQFFTAASDEFQSVVDQWVSAGVAAEWTGRIMRLQEGRWSKADAQSPRYVGIPSMSSICRHLTHGLQISTQTRIEKLHWEHDSWTLTVSRGATLSGYHFVIVATPPQQAADLIPEWSELRKSIDSVSMSSCWSVMAAFEYPLEVQADGLYMEGKPVSWAARNSSKPGRSSQLDAWVLQASAEWSANNLEADRSRVADRSLHGFFVAIDIAAVEPFHLDAHRWRYAIAETRKPQIDAIDLDHRIAVCGDWCRGDRVEHAFLQGSSVARVVVHNLQ